MEDVYTVDEAWEGKCPTCPAEPLPDKRGRCPICREWITWTPEHPGHKIKLLKNGKPYWMRSHFKPRDLAFLGHTNANRETHTGQAFIDTFYERVKPEQRRTE